MRTTTLLLLAASACGHPAKHGDEAPSRTVQVRPLAIDVTGAKDAADCGLQRQFVAGFFARYAPGVAPSEFKCWSLARDQAMSEAPAGLLMPRCEGERCDYLAWKVDGLGLSHRMISTLTLSKGRYYGAVANEASAQKHFIFLLPLAVDRALYQAAVDSWPNPNLPLVNVTFQAAAEN